jgi:hypothetical protein
VNRSIASLVATVVVCSPFVARSDELHAVECCTHATDRTPCVPDDTDTDVLGYRTCPHYGTWGQNLRDPDVFVQLGVNLRYFALPASHPGLSARTSMPSPMSSAARRGRAEMFDERFGYLLAPGFYTAFDFELGSFGGLLTDDTPELHAVIDGLVSFGARGSLGPFAPAAEISMGAMEAAFPTDHDAHGAFVLEARGRLDLWITPWLTLGGSIGTSLIDRGQQQLGFYIGVHSWSFAGEH